MAEELMIVKPNSGSTSITPCCPFSHSLQDHVPITPGKDISTGFDASGTRHCDGSVPSKPGLQQGASDRGDLRRASRKTYEAPSGACTAKTNLGARPRSGKPRRFLKSTTKKICGRTKVNRATVSRLNGELETVSTQGVSDVSVQTSPGSPQRCSCVQHAGERGIGEHEGDVDTSLDYSIDSVRLTDRELETCRRIDSLARSRMQSRGATTAAKDQNTSVACQRRSHVVEEQSPHAMVVIESLDLGTESGHVRECSGDRAGGLTYRSDTQRSITMNMPGEQTSVRGPDISERNATTGTTLFGSGGLQSTAVIEPVTTEGGFHRLTSVLGPVQVFVHHRSGNTQVSNQRNRTTGEKLKGKAQELKAGVEKFKIGAQELKYGAKQFQVGAKDLKAGAKDLKAMVKDLKNGKKEFKVSGKESNYITNYKDSPRWSTSVQDSSVSFVVNSSDSSSSSSSFFETWSQTSIATTVTESARSTMRAGIETKKDRNISCSTAEGLLVEMRPASRAAASPGKRSVLPAAPLDAATTSDNRPRVRVKIPTQVTVGSVGTHGAIKGTRAGIEERRQQKMSSKYSGPSTGERSRWMSSRPVQSGTVVLEATTSTETLSVQSSVNSLTYRLPRIMSPLSSNRSLGNVRPMSRLCSVKSSWKSEATAPGSSRSTGSGKAARLLRYPSSTKASELRLTSLRGVSAMDSDEIGAKLRLRYSPRMADGYSQLEKARSIPVEFILKGISRDVYNRDVKLIQKLDNRKDSAKFCSDVKQEQVVTRVSEVFKGATTITTDPRTVSPTLRNSRNASARKIRDLRIVSPVSGISRQASARTDDSMVACCPRDFAVSPKKLTEERHLDISPSRRSNHDQRTQGFVCADPKTDISLKRSQSDKVVSEKGESSLKFRYYGVQEKFTRAPTRTFLVSDSTVTTPQKRRPFSPIRQQQQQPQIVQNTKRTFLIGQSCVRKISVGYPENVNTSELKPRRLKSLQRRRSQSADLEQRSEISNQSNTQRDELNSSEGYSPPPSSRARAGTPVTLLHSNRLAVQHSNMTPPRRKTQLRSPSRHSSFSTQPQQLCSTPILGSNRQRSPLFFSPIPYQRESPKVRSPTPQAKSRNYSPNTSNTSSPTSASSSSWSQPLRRNTHPLISFKVPQKKVVNDRLKKAATKGDVPTEPATLKNPKSSSGSCGVRQNRTSNSVPDHHLPRKSYSPKAVTLKPRREEEEGISKTAHSSRVPAVNTSRNSVKWILYKNLSKPVNATLSNGKRSMIPQATWYPFHIVPAETDVSRFRLRINYDEIPPRSFRYSKAHRKFVEDRLPACIRQLPKLMLGKAVVKNKRSPKKV